MAAGRDIARHSRLIRKAQVARNLEALKEAEAKRTEQEALSAMTPGEIRRHATRARKVLRAARGAGHHGVGPVEEMMMGPGSIDDKMDRGGEDKAVVLFASPQAQALAEERGILAEFLIGQKPSSEYGFTKSDITGFLPEAEAPSEGEGEEAPSEGEGEEGREPSETGDLGGEGAKGDAEAGEGEGTREKGGEAPEVLYASPKARALAEEGGLTGEELKDWAPSGPKGFSVDDIRKIIFASTTAEGEG